MNDYAKPPAPILVLASKSPRRLEIIGRSWEHSFTVKPSSYEEDKPNKNEFVQNYTSRIALEKVKAMSINDYPNRFFVTADTAVSIDGTILLKPSSKIDALDMLNKLKGQEHIVSTSLTIYSVLMDNPLSINKLTRVNFRNYSNYEMNRYIKTGSSFDKAGGYAIQDQNFQPANNIDGCYLNVVGLPICALRQLIDKICPGYGKSIKLLSCIDC
tara:strand:- start:4665 stop:5306 length:642 start_codon:yes stop_codon:yes gene_type:complete